MPKDRVDLQVLRSLVFEFLLHQQNTQFSNVLSGVKHLAAQKGYPGSVPQSAPVMDEQIREIVWTLIIQGVLVPGNQDPNSSFPWLSLTPYGTECLKAGEFLPHDPEGYLNRLKAQVPAIDPIVLVYLTEALETFRTNNYLAAAVMAGVASEKTMLLVIDMARGALNSSDKKGAFEKATDRRSIKKQYKELRKRLDPLMPQLSDEVSESVSTYLDGIFNFIRNYRNDAGHPTGRKIEREEAFAILQLFPTYCVTAYGLIGWLQKNQA